MRISKSLESRSALINITANVMSMMAFPLYLYYFTSDTYGLWVTVSALAGICAFFELGISLPLQRFFIDGESLRFFRLLRVGVSLQLIATALTLILAAEYIQRNFSSVATDHSLIAVLILLAGAELLSVMASMAQSILNVAGDALICGKVRLLSQSIRLSSIVILLANGFGLIGVAIAHFISTVIDMLGSTLYVQRHIRGLQKRSSKLNAAQSSLRADLASGLDQWFLNIYNNFSIRLILLLLEYLAFQNAISLGVGSVEAKTESLKQTGQAFIVYRVVNIVYLAIKQGLPSYYHKALSVTDTFNLFTTPALLFRTLISAYIAGVSVVLIAPEMAMPESLVFLKQNIFTMILVSVGFSMLFVLELSNYVLMVRGHLRHLKGVLLINMALCFVIAAALLQLGRSVVESTSLAVIVGATVYSGYLLLCVKREHFYLREILQLVLRSILVVFVSAVVPITVLFYLQSYVGSVFVAFVTGTLVFLITLFISGISQKFISKYVSN